ncbi:hypothetical protein ES703_00356 [subsurface metagenome]
MKGKLKAHLWTLPRWFAIPFFGSSILLGSVLAGGINLNAWLGLIAGLLVMAGGHAFNSFLDWKSGLDQGEVEDRSAEKDYCGGQNLIAAGIVSVRETAFNGIGCYALSAIPIGFLVARTGWPILIFWLMGMLISFWYSWGKFNWTHELSLGIGVGPVCMLLGMFAVSPSPDWGVGLAVGGMMAVILSFGGLPLDEWPDAEANLKRGVKSIAYKVWEYDVDLGTYMMWWFVMMYVYQVLLIAVGFLAPLTALTFILFPFLAGGTVFLKRNFRKAAGIYVLILAFYPILILVGQMVGG